MAVIGLISLSGCAGECQNTEVERVFSSDGKHEAVLFQRDCGATTAFSTQISVIAVGEGASGGGNAFVADDDHGRARVGEWEGPWAEVKWLSSKRIRISYAANSRVFYNSKAVGPIKILYQPL